MVTSKDKHVSKNYFENRKIRYILSQTGFIADKKMDSNIKLLRVPALLCFLCVLLRHTRSANPADHHATAETRNLYHTLLAYTNNPNKIMFGQHRATAEGCSGGHLPYRLGDVHNGHQSWTFTTVSDPFPEYKPFTSKCLQDAQRLAKSADELCDIKDVTGQYPAVVGFDLRKLDSSYLLTIGWLIKKANEKGLIVTVSWHQQNPVSGTSAYVRDDTGSNIQHIIRRLLVNGDLNGLYRQRLDLVADWFRNLTDSAGKPIPIIFRPYHEMNKDWFWWGTDHSTNNTAADFRHLFKYTVQYLRDTRNVNNLLYAISPSKPNSLNTYYNFYPGDNFVDVVGMDFYYSKPFSPSIGEFIASVRILTEVATAHAKPAAITEVGIQDNGIEKYHAFWMDHVLTLLKGGKGTTKVAFMLTWANFCMNRKTIYVPYHRHAAASNFREFYNDTVMVFGSVINNGNSVIVG